MGLPWYSMTVTLDGQSYGLEMAYNNRADRWALTLSNASQEAIVSNLPVLIDRPLFAPYKHLDVPPGAMVCIDTTGNQAQPTMGSFLRTHVMYYLSFA